MVFVGIDWAEVHHDVCMLDEAGSVLAKRRLPGGLEGVPQGQPVPLDPQKIGGRPAGS